MTNCKLCGVKIEGRNKQATFCKDTHSKYYWKKVHKWKPPRTRERLRVMDLVRRSRQADLAIIEAFICELSHKVR